MYFKITRCRLTTRLQFFCGLKTLSGDGIIADKNAASSRVRFDADLLK
jgi:hypothetical protein